MLSLALMLFLIMDPFGNIVTLNTLLDSHTQQSRRLILLRESAIATALLLLSALIGGQFLRTLGLAEHSLSISGGIVLFLIAMGMLFPSRRIVEDTALESPLIVPIAMPLIAGPSAISMVILFSEQHSLSSVCGAVLIASAASAVLLTLSPSIFRWLGKRGANAVVRLMGMLLVMISVQMILDGIDVYLTSRS